MTDTSRTSPDAGAGARGATPARAAGEGTLALARLLSHAADAVAAVQAGRSLTEALQAVPAPARAGAQALAFATLRHLAGAQAVRRALAPRAPAAWVDALLACALTQLWPGQASGHAEHTVVNQAVEAVRRRHAASAGFVNAVLRRFLRERTTLVAQLQARDQVVAHEHPRWWIDAVRADWPEGWEALLAAAQTSAPMMLRVNARHGDAQAYAQELLAAGGGQAQVLGSHALCLARAVPVGQLPGFAQGRVSVQDASAQLAAPLLLGPGDADPLALLSHAPAVRWPPGARVLDACAAPGGKTAQLLELADLDLLALDVDAQRLARVEENLQRLGLRAELKAADAAQTAQWWDGRPFDAILLDAPCSASGIVRRHPDVRWLRRSDDIAALARTQAGLLDALWPLLKPGGRLVYATCSLFRAEGEAQIAAFLQRTTGVNQGPSPGHVLPLADNRRLTAATAAWPGDGFYYACLDKQG